MLQKILLLTAVAVVYCQYPQQRAPPTRYRPPPEEYEDEYAPPPRQAPPQRPAFIANARPAVVHKPASVHYVNIGLELAGDYKFGYDTGKADNGQSFREETRLPDGTVQGAYGYVDETGTQRIVKYTAGKDGFKVEGDGASEAVSRNAPRQAPAPAQPAPAPQQAYRPPPQQAYAPQPAPRPAPQPAPRSQPQPVYRPPPPPQPAYRPPPQPQPRPAYRAPEPEYAPRPQSRPRPAPRPVASYDETPDYDYPNNEIGERRLAPVDTTLFNYNIGTSQDSRN